MGTQDSKDQGVQCYDMPCNVAGRREQQQRADERRMGVMHGAAVGGRSVAGSGCAGAVAACAAVRSVTAGVVNVAGWMVVVTGVTAVTVGMAAHWGVSS